jgi:hypothetical protein
MSSKDTFFSVGQIMMLASSYFTFRGNSHGDRFFATSVEAKKDPGQSLYEFAEAVARLVLDRHVMARREALGDLVDQWVQECCKVWPFNVPNAIAHYVAVKAFEHGKSTAKESQLPKQLVPVEYFDIDTCTRIVSEPREEGSGGCWVVLNSRKVNPLTEFPTVEAAWKALQSNETTKGEHHA